jgi:hypothetical protein
MSKSQTASVRIFVEGKSDEKFLAEYISYCYPKRSRLFQITDIGGNRSLRKNKSYFNEPETLKLVIFDADGVKVPTDKTITERTTDLQAVILEQTGATIPAKQIFLLPNDELNGDLETLLELIVPEQYQPLLSCWEPYVECLETKLNNIINPISSKEDDFTLPDRKAKMYSYVSLFLDEDSQKNAGVNRRYLGSPLWELNHEKLLPLRNFLNEHFLPTEAAQ